MVTWGPAGQNAFSPAQKASEESSGSACALIRSIACGSQEEHMERGDEDISGSFHPFC
jgi:hypothetical protein